MQHPPDLHRLRAGQGTVASGNLLGCKRSKLTFEDRNRHLTWGNVELRGLEPLASCMPCLANRSGIVRDSQVRPGQSKSAVWLGPEPTGAVWARSHLVSHWFPASPQEVRHHLSQDQPQFPLLQRPRGARRRACRSRPRHWPPRSPRRTTLSGPLLTSPCDVQVLGAIPRFGSAREIAASPRDTADDLDRIAAAAVPGTCPVLWGACPEHGSTRMIQPVAQSREGLAGGSWNADGRGGRLRSWALFIPWAADRRRVAVSRLGGDGGACGGCARRRRAAIRFRMRPGRAGTSW